MKNWLLLVALLFSFRTGFSQTILSSFTWEGTSDEKIAVVGPNGTGSGCFGGGNCAYPGGSFCNLNVQAQTPGNGSVQGCAPGVINFGSCSCGAGTCGENVNIRLPNSFGGYVDNYFHRNSLAFKIDFRRWVNELDAKFFSKDNFWFGVLFGKVYATMEYDNGGGILAGNFTFTAFPPTWTLPSLGEIPDNSWRSYEFNYTPATGIARIIIDNGWHTEMYPGVPNSNMYWPGGTNSNPLVLGINADAGKNDVTIFDNAQVIEPAVLPVELIQLHGRQENGKVKLFWSTSSEMSNDYFMIARSQDGESWNQIGITDGAGDHNGIQHYSFLDQNPLNGMNYYKLYQVDFNGSTTGYPAVEVVYNLDGSGFLTLFPNPAQEGNSINIKYQSLEEGRTLHTSIYNLAGQVVLEQDSELYNGINEVNYEVGNFPPGVYFAKFIFNGTSHTERFILIEN